MNNQIKLKLIALSFLSSTPMVGFTAETVNSTKNQQKVQIQQIKSELDEIKQAYEEKIKQLELRLEQAERINEDTQEEVESLAVEISQKSNQKAANTFNPGIGMILNGRFVDSSDDFEFNLPGFFPIDEAGPGEQGLQLGESELNLNANVDDKLYASVTLAFGEETEVEEAFIQTTNLGNGFNIKAGRFFSNIGYLSSKHAHSDNFSSRPLPYQAFIGGNYGDDGIQATWLAPTDLFWESGIELFRGDSFPAAGAADSGLGSWTAYTHIGGDFNESQSWRVGLSLLNAEVTERETEDNEFFSGDSKLWIADFIYKWQLSGEQVGQEFFVQGEYFSRKEKGLFSNNGLAEEFFDNQQTGWYLQGVYRFTQNWRVGLRTSKLNSEQLPFVFNNSLLDPQNISPKQNSIMLDWSNSEYSRIRLQLDDNDLNGKQDNVWILQYIAAFGAHGAHSF